MLEQVEIGHYAKIPIHIARAKVSKSAKSLWIELALVSSPEKPQVWIRQESLAEKMGVSDRTIRRLIIELEKARLITPNGWHQGRHKKYDLAWTNLSDVGGQNSQECPTSSDKNVQLRRTETSNDPGQKCPDLNRVFKQNTEQNIYFKKTGEDFSNPEDEAKTLLAEYGEKWTRRFACLDGLSGRPTVQESIEQALNHSARNKCKDLRIYLESWLVNASKNWIRSYHHELTAPPTDPSLSPDAVARKLKAEQERREKLEQKRLAQERQAQAFSEPLDWDWAFQQLRGNVSKRHKAADFVTQ